MTFDEAQTHAKVEARKRVCSALAEVKRLLQSLDIVPNMRDYSTPDAFKAARQIHAMHVRAVVELQNAMTGEARFLQHVA